MKIMGDKELKPGVAKSLIGSACMWTFKGEYSEDVQKLMAKCTAFHVRTNSMLMLVRDQGMHEQEWLNSPECNQCWHLTISYKDFGDDGEIRSLPHNMEQSREWCELIFDMDFKKVIVEAPFSTEGVEEDVYHFRVFCNKKWTPIVPEGELFDKDLKENQWKTFEQLDEEEDVEDEDIEKVAGPSATGDDVNENTDSKDTQEPVRVSLPGDKDTSKEEPLVTI